jgi:transcription elongation factor SPT5
MIAPQASTWNANSGGRTPAYASGGKTPAYQSGMEAPTPGFHSAPTPGNYAEAPTPGGFRSQYQTPAAYNTPGGFPETPAAYAPETPAADSGPQYD